MKGNQLKKGISILLAAVLCFGTLSLSAPSFLAKTTSAAEESALVSGSDVEDNAEEPEAAAETDDPNSEEMPEATADVQEEEPASTVPESPQADPIATLTNLVVDGVALDDGTNTINSNARIISATIQIADGDEQEWYYQTLFGQQNDIAELKLAGAFDNSALQEISVDPDDLSKINFSFEVNQQPMAEDTGTITVNPANNCFCTPLTVALNVNRVSVGLTDIDVDAADADNPSYTIGMALDGGTFGREITAADLSFEGAFENAEVDSVRIDGGKDAVTIIVTKAPGSDGAGQAQGSLALAPGCVLYPDSSAYDYALSLPLSDDYVAEMANAAPPEGDSQDTQDTADKYLGYTKELANILGDVGGDMLNAVKDASGYRLLMLLPLGTEVIFSIIKDVAGIKEEDPVQKSLDAISTQMQHISEQIGASTKDIIGQVKKSDFTVEVEKVADVADALQDDYYDNYNADVQAALKMLEEGGQVSQKQARQIEDAMQTVYHTNNKSGSNQGYYNAFKSFAKKVSGESAILNKSSIFVTYQAMNSYAYNWNTQTFEEREAFNENVSKFYAQGYTTLRCAIQYDYDLNRKSLATTQKWLEEMQEEADIDAGLQRQMDEMEVFMETCEKNMAVAKSHMETLDALNEKVVEAYEDAAATLAKEQNAYEKKYGVIYSYRLRKNFDKGYSIYPAIDSWRFAETPGGRVCTEAEYRELATSAANRENTLFAEIQAAKFVMGDQGNRATYSGKEWLNRCKGVWIATFDEEKKIGFGWGLFNTTTQLCIKAIMKDNAVNEKIVARETVYRFFASDSTNRNSDLYMLIRPAAE